MSQGQYEEKLSDGGTLCVFNHSWEVKYYFPGPDLRHNGTFLRFGDRDIPKLVVAYQSAYQKYLDLKRTIAPGVELKLEQALNLTIRVGGHFEGICLASYHDPVANDSALQRKLAAYAVALDRAPRIQAMLKQL